MEIITLPTEERNDALPNTEELAAVELETPETPLAKVQKAVALADAARHECERLCSAAIDEILTQHGCELKTSCVTANGKTTHSLYVQMVQ